VDWNKKVPHILVTGSSGGFATVWDVKAKKESLNLNNLGRKAVSAIAWDPSAHTKLATATSNDQDPVILIWDLRNSNAPERTLRLHDSGILSISWCQQDPRLLLSCGKDNRTICWNAQTGEPLGEFPIVTNWTFQTRWDTYSPGLLATASFDGKISVHNIQSTNVDSSKASAAPVADAADFFSSASSRPQAAGFSLPTAPQWLKRPVSARFGFGGKLVKVAPSDTGSKISISTLVADPTVGEASEKFEEIVQKGDFTTFCKSKIQEASTDEDKADWTVIETLISGSRTKLIEYLGFSRSQLVADSEASKQPNGASAVGDEASFFDNAESGGNFLSNLASNKGVKTNNPFQIYTGSESEADRKITQALMLGAFDEALDVCLKEDRMADAFMIAICGGQKCIDKAQSAYFKRQADGPNYLRLIASVVGKNLWDMVYNADLSNWKETMATLCTFADEKEFPDLCEALGDRLEEALQTGESYTRKDASFCYLAGSKLEKVALNWADELKESEQAGLEDGEAESSFSIHAKALQDFIEKVTVFRKVTNFADTEKSKPDNWKLAPLYAKYAEYADILASQGRLEIADKYLDLLPSQYDSAGVAKERIKQATRKAAPVAQKAATSAPGTQRGQRVVPTYQAQQPTMPAQSPAAASPYAPVGVSAAAAPSNPYAPLGYQPPSSQGYQPPSYGANPSPYGGYQPPLGGVAPPPRNASASPSVPPPSKATNLASWNDTPDFGPKQPSRRGTPSIVTQPVISPFANQPADVPPPRSTPDISPPPKAGAARVSSPPSQRLADQYSHPPATNSYAPTTSPPPFPQPQAPPVPRGTSPYNPPPSTSAPTSNRYAPAAGSQPATSQPGLGAPPARQVAPPAGPYAPTNPSPYASSAPPPGPPRATGAGPSAPVAPPPMGRARGPSASEVARPSSSSSNKPTPVPSKYPPGDRSHIPSTAQPIYEILHSEMQRVKSKAPPQYKPQVLDTEKRLNILFDHLNNEDLLKPQTIEDMVVLSRAMQERRHDEAQSLFTDIMTNRTEEGSNWMVS